MPSLKEIIIVFVVILIGGYLFLDSLPPEHNIKAITSIQKATESIILKSKVKIERFSIGHYPKIIQGRHDNPSLHRSVTGSNQVSLNNHEYIAEGYFSIEYRCLDNACAVYINEATAGSITEEKTIRIINEYLPDMIDNLESKSKIMSKI